MNLIWCRITAKYLVQNKKQISAKKAENLHFLVALNFLLLSLTTFQMLYPYNVGITS